jgi:putative alpha-1,2-mannosidase
MNVIQIGEALSAKTTVMLQLIHIVLILCIVQASVVAIDHPEELVNLLAGSFTDGDRFSTGNTLPLVGRPWGFNHWAPQTRDGSRHTGSWWFKGSDHQFTWLRCTHQPSPWIGDWGWFLFSPQIGPITRNPVHFWEPRAAVLKPYLLDATVAPYGIRMELAPTDHGAFLRVTFPPSSASGGKILTLFSVLKVTSNTDCLVMHPFFFCRSRGQTHLLR